MGAVLVQSSGTCLKNGPHRSGCPTPSHPPTHTLGVSWRLGSPHGKRARGTSVNNLERKSLRVRNGTCLNPLWTRWGRPLPTPLPLPLARPAAFASWVFSQSQAGFSEKCRARCLLPGSGPLKGPLGPWGRMTRVRDRRQRGSSDPRNQAALHHTRRGEGCPFPRNSVLYKIPLQQCQGSGCGQEHLC